MGRTDTAVRVPGEVNCQMEACFRPQLSKRPGLGEAGGGLRMENWQEMNFSGQSEEQAGAGPSKQD